MYLQWLSPLLLLICLTTALADFLGPTYPPPVDLTSEESSFPKIWKNFSKTVDTYLKNNPNSAPKIITVLENVTFSVRMFSLRDPAATELQSHYTAAEVAKSDQGATDVNGDGIYKVASVSKLITAYAGMLESTDADWNRPLTDIFPILADSPGANFGGKDPAHAIKWDQVTPWALASQLAGVPVLGLPSADYLLVDLAEQNKTGSGSIFGFPSVDVRELGTCSNPEDPYCIGKGDDFVASLRSRSPSFLPWTTPGYSDNGFMLLRLVISRITGKPIETVYQETTFDPIGMKSSISPPQLGSRACPCCDS
jgi:CubicO group peptidase (beta-lactamase class C family)